MFGTYTDYNKLVRASASGTIKFQCSLKSVQTCKVLKPCRFSFLYFGCHTTKKKYACVAKPNLNAKWVVSTCTSAKWYLSVQMKQIISENSLKIVSVQIACFVLK